MSELQIPNDWESEKFQNIISIKHGHQFRTHDFVKNDGIKVCKISQLGKNGKLDLSNCDMISFNRLEEFSNFLIKKNDLLVSLTGNIGNVVKVNEDLEPLLQNYRVGKFTSKNENKIINDFLQYFLKSNLFKIQINSKINHTVIGNIGKSDLEKITIIYPSIKIQKRIVEKIEELFSLVDSAKDTLEKTKVLLKQYRQSILKHAFEGKLVPQDPNDEPAYTLLENYSKHSNSNKESLEKEIPFGWCFVTLGDISDVLGGKRLPKGHSFSDVKTNYPYLRVTDFENLGINEKSLKFLKPETHNLIKKYTISSNDVYISIAGAGLGQVGIIPVHLNGANLTENSAKFTNIKINQKFLCYLVNSEICQNPISKLITSSAQPKLALFRIKKMIVPLPPLNEQKRIVAKIEESFSLIEKNEILIDKLLLQYSQIKNSILKQAFEGKLVPQDPNDEPAEVLLQRIREEKKK